MDLEEGHFSSFLRVLFLQEAIGCDLKKDVSTLNAIFSHLLYFFWGLQARVGLTQKNLVFLYVPLVFVISRFSAAGKKTGHS